jgi:hypothetical protein
MKHPERRNRLPAAAICAALAGGFCLAAQHAPAPGAPTATPPAAPPAAAPAPAPSAPSAAGPAAQPPPSPESSAPRSRRQRLDPPRYPPSRFEAKSKDLNDFYDEPKNDAGAVTAEPTPQIAAPADAAAAPQGAPPAQLPAVRTVPSSGSAAATTAAAAAPPPAAALSTPAPPWLSSIAAMAMLVGPAVALLWLVDRQGPGSAN